MVTAKEEGTKIVLKLTEGSQTIADCNPSANDEQLYALGTAVGSLEKKEIDTISKVVESVLISE